MIFSPPSRYHGPRWAGLRVGLLGGSFNPAHAGHMHISTQAVKHLNLHAVWWMVTPQNPLKSAQELKSLDERITYARLYFDHPRIVVTDIERQIGTRYTIDTLRKLRQLFPHTHFVWLMGSENIQQFHLWRDWQKIFQTIPFAAIHRPPHVTTVQNSPLKGRFQNRLVTGTVVGQSAPCWKIIQGPLNPVSSTKIRMKTDT